MGKGGGKHQHSKDKLYIVATEWRTEWGGYNKKLERENRPYRALPFNCCGLSLLPFEHPVCTRAGIVFDSRNILPYIKEYKRNPVTGESLKVSDLIALHFHKNSNGEYHCPVTFKVFNHHTHIVANCLSGHVYAFEAVDNLCRIPKRWKDPLTAADFSFNDLVTIQDPHKIQHRKIDDFDFIKKGQQPRIEFSGLPVDGSGTPYTKTNEFMHKVLEEAAQTSKESIEKHNQIVRNVHHEKQKAEQQQSSSSEAPVEKKKHALYTNYAYAASFTSTELEPTMQQEMRPLTDKEEREVCYERLKKSGRKAYVRLVTSMGNLNLRLHCDITPEAADNFLRHCGSGYYKDTIFHRCIPGFMIQGGDPEGIGVGGESAFEGGHAFADELTSKLRHDKCGIVAYANNGRNTNRSQFYITFNECSHLDNKHTIFGEVVGGMETLRQMEMLEIHKKNDKPKDPPKIVDTLVFQNPFVDILKEDAEKEQQEKTKKEKDANSIWFSDMSGLDPMKNHPKRNSDEVGKYLIIPERAKKKKQKNIKTDV